jgi:zinc protease
LARASEELGDEEVLKAKRQIVAEVAYERDGTHNVAVQMSEAEAVADWRFYNSYARNRRARHGGRRAARGRRLLQRGHAHGRPLHPEGERANGSNGDGPSSGPASSKRALRPHGFKFHHEPLAKSCGGGASQSGVVGLASRVAREELSSGAALLVLENTRRRPSQSTASLRAGSYFEPKDKPGLARITAEMLKRGTRRRGKLELAGALEQVGADVEFDADAFAVRISARSLAQDFPALVSTLAEMLREPSFPEDELEKLKQQTVAAIREQQSDTRWRAYERLTQTLFDEENPFYTHAGERLVESVGSITVEDVRGFYEKFYGGRSLILSAAATCAPEALGVMREAFEGFEGPERIDVEVRDPEPGEGARREFVIVKDKANVDVMLGSAAPLRRDAADYYAAVLANRALGESTLSSRLGLQVRDVEGTDLRHRLALPRADARGGAVVHRGLGQPFERRARDRLGAQSPARVRRARHTARRVGRREEFGRRLVQGLALDERGAGGRALERGVLPARPRLRRPIPELIRAVTTEEVNAAIRKYFRPDHLTVVIAGDTTPRRASPRPSVNAKVKAEERPSSGLEGPSYIKEGG